MTHTHTQTDREREREACANKRPLPVGIESYDVSLEKQEATVIAKPELDYETVLKTIKKTGKKVNSGEVDGVSRSIEVEA